MGNQNPKPQLSAEKNVSEIEEQDINQDQQQSTFAELDKRKFLHQICSNTIFHKAKKLRQQNVAIGRNWIVLGENSDGLISARVNKILKIHRLNHLHQINNSMNFLVGNVIGQKQFKFEDCSNVKSVLFYFHDANGQANSEDKRQLGMTVSTHLVHLRKLHLYFQSKIEGKAVRSFLSACAKHVKLTDFDLALSYVTIEQGNKREDFRELFSVICKSHSGLKNLRVKLNDSKGLTDKALVAFGHDISTHLLKLNQLELCFTYSEAITDNGLIGFFENLTKNKRGLNQLTLRFEHFSSITAHRFNHFECQLLQSFPDLQRLSLNFTNCGRLTLTLNEDEEQIELKKPSNVTSLKLDFGRSFSIRDSGLQSLTRHIAKYFPVLQELTLNLTGCNNVVGWNSALATNEWSKNLTALRSLNLSLWGCQWFTDMNLESLAIDLRNGFSALESLSLDLSSHSSFTDKGLESLGSAISSSLKNLKQLTLDFRSCKQITDKGFEMLLSDLRKMKILKGLCLFFTSCDGLTEKILPMIESIYVQNDFADAKEVRFDLTDCRQISILAKQTRRLKRLLSHSKITLWI